MGDRLSAGGLLALQCADTGLLYSLGSSTLERLRGEEDGCGGRRAGFAPHVW